MRWLVARVISKPPPSAAPLIAATTGLGSFSSRRSGDLTRSHSAKISAASAFVAWLISLRSPPAKKVFFALAITTPVTLSASAASSSSMRRTAASIEST